MSQISRAFRATLSEELPKWADEGLVTPEVADLLRHRYRLDEDGGAYAALAVYLLGAMLVGGGVISFIAWNWAYLPNEAKLAGGVGLLLAVQVAGYLLGRVDGRYPWLGQGLIFLGLLLFGANLGLFAQVFGVHDHWRNGIGAWALVGVVLAIAVESIPCAVTATVLAFAWAIGQRDATPDLAPIVAYGLTAAVVALAFRFRSGLIVGLSCIGITLLLTREAVAWSVDGHGAYFVPLAVCIAMLGASLFDTWSSTTLRRLGIGGVTLLAYTASFEHFAEELPFANLADYDAFSLAVLAAPAVLVGVIATAVHFTRSQNRRRLRPSDEAVVAVLAGAGAIVVGALTTPVGLWLAAHIALVGLVAVSIRRALQELERGPFWFGVVIGGLVILTRFLEFETGLLFKAAAFTCCGLVVIGIGYAFEIRRREVLSHGA